MSTLTQHLSQAAVNELIAGINSTHLYGESAGFLASAAALASVEWLDCLMAVSAY